MAALHRTITTTDRDDMAMGVGGDLNFDVAPIAHHRFDKERSIAEGGGRFRFCRSKCVGQFFGAFDHSNTAATPAGCGLEYDRKTNPFGVGERIRFIRNFATTPFRDRYAGLFSKSLRSDLVAERPHRVSTGTEK